jgi:hypothetical protein
VDWGTVTRLKADRMSMLQKKVEFPTKLWLLLSLGIFVYLFFWLPIEGGKGVPRPTLLLDLPDGMFLDFVLCGVAYFLAAFCSGFFIAAIFGVFKTLLRKHDPLEIPPGPTPASK